VKVTPFVYKDYKLNLVITDDEAARIHEKYAKLFNARRYSFVAMRWHPKRRRLFLGCTSTGGDILVEFDPAKGTFRSCGYARSGLRGPTEDKIHKGLWLDEEEDALYFGTASLAPAPRTVGRPGGSLVRYRIAERKFERLARPVVGSHIQATIYDRARRMIYFYTLPALGFGVFDLRKRKLVRHDAMGSIPHIGCLDDAGGVWGTYGFSAQAFFRYVPEEDRYEFPTGCVFPCAVDGANVAYKGSGPVDSLLNGGDGWLYAGSTLGEFFRIEPRSGKVEHLGKPFPGKRLPAMCLADDGMIYLSGGQDKKTMLGRYDRATGSIEKLGPVADRRGRACFRAHEIAVVDGTAYIGETDNQQRSGYLWACEV